MSAIRYHLTSAGHVVKGLEMIREKNTPTTINSRLPPEHDDCRRPPMEYKT